MTEENAATTEASVGVPVVQEKKKGRVLVLVATIPSRKIFCERVLKELANQMRLPDGVVLVLDGYGEAAAPSCPLPVIATYRTAEPTGPGNRWRVAADLEPDDILICLDDDMFINEAPGLIRSLVNSLETGWDAAAAMGKDLQSKYSAPGGRSRGDLIYAAGSGRAVRVKHLLGLQQFAKEVKDAGGPDSLSLLGDDDALVSAYLWKNKVAIHHSPTGNIYEAPGTKETSQTQKRRARHEDLDAQKALIQKITGWPCFLTPPVARPGMVNGTFNKATAHLPITNRSPFGLSQPPKSPFGPTRR